LVVGVDHHSLAAPLARASLCRALAYHVAYGSCRQRRATSTSLRATADLLATATATAPAPAPPATATATTAGSGSARQGGAEHVGSSTNEATVRILDAATPALTAAATATAATTTATAAGGLDEGQVSGVAGSASAAEHRRPSARHAATSRGTDWHLAGSRHSRRPSLDRWRSSGHRRWCLVGRRWRTAGPACRAGLCGAAVQCLPFQEPTRRTATRRTCDGALVDRVSIAAT